MKKEYLCKRFASVTILVVQLLKAGYVRCEMENPLKTAIEAVHPKILWHDQRRKNRKQNWRNFRQRTFA